MTKSPPTETYLKPSELANFAISFIESMHGLSAFSKQEVIAIANVLVEVEVRRHITESKSS